ncbi:MAG: electron transfer flavoprotein subunit alpha/FixB family protein [Proteobacteria bacterium]|nr:electron transfer flavoprotein subunit alpha/FixB family protein [Pseudomonadota bacterium]MBU1581937.1 electron transfer flavoprotein subunit alpha/FixB family protein [Pseudomonadota bacterium]MBU2454640.1 electron transfer flavoprotein subunit alpha/FixB family protein [Pseudomonadota bacterium]MBU2630261.1 electron transfer flavoprotein subunit alpha/FixB family protein [Pseudomonadota bacterium]
MARTGILIEIENGAVKETSLGVMTAAAGHQIYALVQADDVPSVKDKLSEYGADNIVGIKASGDVSKSPDLEAQVLAAVIKEYDLEAFLGTASTTGKDLFARLAAILDEPLVSDCVQVNIAEKTVKKSHFSGKTFATLKVNSPLLLCTLRPNSIEPAAAPAPGNLMVFTANVADPGLIKIVETKKAGSGMLDLTEAPIVITGGRAIKAAENYKMLEACAKKIGAAVGASRAAVDAGFAPHSMQVGQTGKTVSPRLYIACGVSGAVQHFAGMKTSKVIVAINEDKDAPIFSKCDYGIVGDIFEVVPVLTEKL